MWQKIQSFSPYLVLLSSLSALEKQRATRVPAHARLSKLYYGDYWKRFKYAYVHCHRFYSLFRASRVHALEISIEYLPQGKVRVQYRSSSHFSHFFLQSHCLFTFFFINPLEFRLCCKLYVVHCIWR